MKSFFVLCALLCLLVVNLEAKKKNNLDSQTFLGEKTTNACTAPFNLYSGAAGAYLMASNGAPASLTASPKIMFCLNANGNLVTADGILLLQQSQTGVLLFGGVGTCPTCSVPQFTTLKDSLNRFYFSSSANNYLCTFGYDPTSSIVIAAFTDSRPRWFVEDANLKILTSIAGVTSGTFTGGSGGGSGGSGGSGSGTSICANPFALFNVATGGYLLATAGVPASFTASIKSMFCLQNKNLFTSDGTLSLQQPSGSSILYFDNPGPSANPMPSFITRVDALFHIEFVSTTGMCGVSLASLGWDQNSQIGFAGCAVFDSRQLWFAEKQDGTILHSIS